MQAGAKNCSHTSPVTPNKLVAVTLDKLVAVVGDTAVQRTCIRYLRKLAVHNRKRSLFFSTPAVVHYNKGTPPSSIPPPPRHTS